MASLILLYSPSFTTSTPAAQLPLDNVRDAASNALLHGRDVLPASWTASSPA
ncbi:MAG TPA: hypothetical protein VFG86_26970 [Chloroflexota bacterium]|nr:hypothetical protein [Chloroflexota bacterium]